LDAVRNNNLLSAIAFFGESLDEFGIFRRQHCSNPALLLQELDGASERGLRDVTLPRRLREVQLLANG
jgi:hypothetical protein